MFGSIWMNDKINENIDETFDYTHTHKINDLMRNGVKWGGKLMNYVDAIDKDLPFLRITMNGPIEKRPNVFLNTLVRKFP